MKPITDWNGVYDAFNRDCSIGDISINAYFAVTLVFSLGRFSKLLLLGDPGRAPMWDNICEENWDSKPTFEARNWSQLCRSGCVLHLEGLDDNGRFSEFNLG